MVGSLRSMGVLLLVALLLAGQWWCVCYRAKVVAAKSAACSCCQQKSRHSVPDKTRSCPHCDSANVAVSDANPSTATDLHLDLPLVPITWAEFNYEQQPITHLVPIESPPPAIPPLALTCALVL